MSDEQDPVIEAINAARKAFESRELITQGNWKNVEVQKELWLRLLANCEELPHSMALVPYDDSGHYYIAFYVPQEIKQ